MKVRYVLQICSELGHYADNPFRKKCKREDLETQDLKDDNDEKKGPTKNVRPLIMNARAGTKYVRPRCTYRQPTPYASPSDWHG